MELDLYTRIGLVLAGLLLILFVNVDFTYLISKLVFRKKDEENFTEKDFLHMINLWYKLKHMCTVGGFSSANKKLDEVFPLLNNGDKNE
jgi:hypothetical protein